MQTLKLENVALSAVCACLPPTAEDSLARCTALYGDPVRAENVVKATGIRRRRLAPEGVSSLDLCTQAAERLLTDAAQARGQPLDAVRASIGAVLCVTFTPARAMPCNACQAQRRLGLGNDVIAFDIGLACSGYAYGLYMAGLLARQTGKDVLLLDGDVQSPRLDPNDAATVPVLADAGTASLVSPVAGSAPWRFAFMSKGEDGDALALPHDGVMAMDGFAVFRFVAKDVSRFIKEFLAETRIDPASVDAFVPHQANVYMVRQLALSLGMPEEKLLISADEVGNSASATVPVTLARAGSELSAAANRRILLAGFGGGLSAAVAHIELASGARLVCIDWQH